MVTVLISIVKTYTLCVRDDSNHEVLKFMYVCTYTVNVLFVLCYLYVNNYCRIPGIHFYFDLY